MPKKSADGPVSPSRTKEYKAAYNKRYGREHRAEINAKRVARRRANPETFRARDNAWWRRAFHKDPKRMWLARAWNSKMHQCKLSGIPGEKHDLECPDVCPVLGLTLNYGMRGRHGAAANSPSLDRIVPKLGYIPGNVRIISYRANVLLNNATSEELEKVAAFRKEDERRLSADVDKPPRSKSSSA